MQGRRTDHNLPQGIGQVGEGRERHLWVLAAALLPLVLAGLFVLVVQIQGLVRYDPAHFSETYAERYDSQVRWQMVEQKGECVVNGLGLDQVVVVEDEGKATP